MNEARERPILFSAPMVQAILAGRKTMTRRVMKPQPRWDRRGYGLDGVWRWRDFEWPDGGVFSASGIDYAPIRPGDLLWVRETWRETGVKAEPYAYRADEPESYLVGENGDVLTIRYRWRPSIHMPREAARLFLRVTGVRVERVQDITTDDCIAEGMDCDNKINNPDPATHQSIVNWNYAYARYLFRELWDGLNAKRGFGWDANPWVWVVTFRREEKENV